MTGLDPAQLAAFAAVIEEGSFDAAARRLRVTPSAVSQRIKALESRMGQVLVRRARPARPTEAGQVLARLAHQLSLLEGEALAEISGGTGHRPRIPIAVNADSLATWFLPALAALPEASFDIHQEDQDHSVALLRDGAVMAAVTAEPRAVQGCRVEGLGAMRYLAVCSPDFHRRHLPDGPTVAALSGAPMLVFNRKDALQERFARLASGRRLDPPVTYLPSSQGSWRRPRSAWAGAWCPNRWSGRPVGGWDRWGALSTPVTWSRSPPAAGWTSRCTGSAGGWSRPRSRRSPPRSGPPRPPRWGSASR